MKLSTLTAAALLGRASAESMAVLKELKMKAWSQQQETGAYDLNRYASVMATTPCVNGKAGEYQCNKVDLVSFLRHQDMGSSTRKGNDICKFTHLTHQKRKKTTLFHLRAGSNRYLFLKGAGRPPRAASSAR